MLLLLFTFTLLPVFARTSVISSKNNTIQYTSERRSSSSFGNAVVDVQHFTQFIYEGNQVYVYSAKMNDEYEHQPLKWSFYYVPILQPIKSSNMIDWAWVTKKEVRMKLVLGNDQIEDAARRAIARRFDTTVANNYSQLWIVAPLMIDSMTGFVVKMSGEPVEGVAPYHLVHPSALITMLRFECSETDVASDIVEKLINGDYEIEINLYFASFKQVSSNIISITGENLRSVLSKTMADGGNSNAKYIHRDQTNKFINRYTSNVKKMIYIEKHGVDLSTLTNGLDEQFTALLHQGMNSATEVQLSAKLYDQVWHASDLNPDRLTNELNKMFILNNTATQKYNNTDIFFNINSQSAYSSSSTSGGSGGINLLDIFSVSASSSETNSATSNRNNDKTTYDVMSANDIQHRMKQHSIEIEWTGEKFEPKSFSVFKLTDVTDRLQVAIISKHMYAEKQNGAISRRVSALNSPIIAAVTRSSMVFPGEIRLFAGVSSPPFNWLVCNGSVLARADYSKLFNAIGTQYGIGNEGETYFRLPDLRGRVAIGVDKTGSRIPHAEDLGVVGGQESHILTVQQLPLHEHDKGELTIQNGGTHAHVIHDPGHLHRMSNTVRSPNDEEVRSCLPIMFRGGGKCSYNSITAIQHGHGIKTGDLNTDMKMTGISLDSAGDHSHALIGKTGTTGGGKQFSLLQPFQTFNYIIYAGD